METPSIDNPIVPRCIKYVGDIWRPESRSQTEEIARKEVPLAEVINTNQSNDMLKRKYFEETGRREPPDGSSRTSLNEHLEGMTSADKSETFEKCELGVGITSCAIYHEMELDEHMKRLGEHEEALYIQGVHTVKGDVSLISVGEQVRGKRQTPQCKLPEEGDRKDTTEGKNKSEPSGEISQVNMSELNNTIHRDVILHRPNLQQGERSDISSNIQDYSEKPLPSTKLQCHSKEELPPLSLKGVEQGTNESLKKVPSQDSQKSVGIGSPNKTQHTLALVSKRQRWLEQMRAECLPASFVESMTSEGQDMSAVGFIRMRYRNFRRRLHGRTKSDGDSQSYCNKGYDRESDEVVELDAFKHYRNTIARKGRIKFRRRRRASIPLDIDEHFTD